VCLGDVVRSGVSILDLFLLFFGSGAGLSTAFRLVGGFCQSGLSAASNKAFETSVLGDLPFECFATLKATSAILRITYWLCEWSAVPPLLGRCRNEAGWPIPGRVSA
jgi:hypothetical protein